MTGYFIIVQLMFTMIAHSEKSSDNLEDHIYFP